jgi:hypothetical protein
MPAFEITSLKEWWKGSDEDTAIRLPVIDIRESQQDGQLMRQQNGITVVHLPFSDLQSGERSCELPPRHVSFAILTTVDLLESARDFLGATTSRATKQSRKPWLVEQVLLANDELWGDANDLGILQTEEKIILTTSFQPLPRLWQPDPLIQNVLWPLLNERRTASTPQEIWDLGSGAGRDVCFLAEHAKASGIDSYQFVGIDHHKASAKRCLPFWKHRHVQDRTEARNVDLSKLDRVQEAMNGRDIACLYAVRFWNAKLDHFIATNAQLKTGTLFAMSHFCKPYPGAPWDFDHPKVRLQYSIVAITILVFACF